MAAADSSSSSARRTLLEARQQVAGAEPALLGAAEVVEDAAPVHHDRAGRRGSTACCIECVTISVVSLSRRDDLLAQGGSPGRRSSGRAPPCARRAAAASACSHDAISSVSAWRWPPDRLPIALSRRSSSPMLQPADAVAQLVARPTPRSAQPSPRRPPAPRRQREVLGDRHVRRRAAERVLEHAADQRRAAVLRPARDVACRRARCVPASTRKRAGHRVQQRRLARAVRADDDDERAFGRS